MFIGIPYITNVQVKNNTSVYVNYNIIYTHFLARTNVSNSVVINKIDINILIPRGCINRDRKRLRRDTKR